MNKYIKTFIIIIALLFTINVSAVTTTTVKSIKDVDTKTTTSRPTKNVSRPAEISHDQVYEDVNGYTILIDDQAGLLTTEEVSSLKEKMKELVVYGNIGFVSVSSNSTSIERFAEQYYHRYFKTESGTIFVIDMDNRMIYIFSDGENYKYITKSKANSITDNIYRYATREEYYECASKAFHQIGTVLNGGKIAEPMRLVSNGFLAVTISLFISFLYVLSVSKSSRASQHEILKGVKSSFASGEADGHLTGSHSVYSPQSSGGGSSGGGGGGGGGSSGGGGGHSF